MVWILIVVNNVIVNNLKLFEKKLWFEYGMGDLIIVMVCNDEEYEVELVVFWLFVYKFEWCV